ncbi:MAG UNVERIFIED_CONTAM: integration host factor subunit beta [Planctomycetaceae bacterium]
MTRKEIVKTISEKLGLTQLVAHEIVQKTFEAIIETLAEERRIELRKFGVFEVRHRKARRARNPKTGRAVDVPRSSLSASNPGKKWKLGCKI